MTSTNLSQDTIFALLQSEDAFPVDFDLAWRWYGLSSKGNAKKSFDRVGFTENVDYTLFQVEKRVNGNQGGGSTRTNDIRLSCDCFKTWGMTLTTPKGKEVRNYFLDCEKTLKELLKNGKQPKSKTSAQRDLERFEERIRLKDEARLALSDVVKEWMEYHGWYHDRKRVSKYFIALMDGIAAQLGRKPKSGELIRDYFPVEELRLYLSVHNVLTNLLLMVPIGERNGLKLVLKLSLIYKAVRPN